MSLSGPPTAASTSGTDAAAPGQEVQDVLHRATWDEIPPRVLYQLIRLRVDVFVVEQHCPYPELDGRDLEPRAQHLWLADADGPTAYLRLLIDPDGTSRIGRVCTRADARGQARAATLIRAALAGNPGAAWTLDAQAHLADWYGRFGFVQVGPEYLEDDIPHIPMRRAPATVTT